jgi:hypothetical protein
MFNDKLVTADNKCWKIPPPTATHFATRVQRTRFSSDLIFTILYAGRNIQIASEQFVSWVPTTLL